MKTPQSAEERRAQFARIKEYFATKDRERAVKGKLPLGSTEKGFWGVSHLDDVYEWAERTGLENQSAFLDLGSGDGRVVFVAALFTRATGIEYDAELHRLAEQAATDLGIAATFLCGDYTQHSLTPYPILFTYADHNFRWLEAKRAELTHEHELHLYHDTFHPDFMHKGKITWVNQIPIFVYTVHPRDDDTVAD